MSYQFQGQRANEQILLLARQHPFTTLRSLLIVVVLFLISFASVLWIQTGIFVTIGILLPLAVSIWLLLNAWFTWNHTLLLLTNERVVFLDQTGLFKRELIECNLPSIQQVSHSVHGVFHTLLGYGTITIYSGGAPLPIQIPNMPDPYDLQQEILRAQSGEGFVGEDEPDEDTYDVKTN